MLFLTVLINGNGGNIQYLEKDGILTATAVLGRKNEDITIKELCMWLWGVENEVKASELSSYISDLRKKLKPDESIELLRGFGGTYKLITMEL